MAEGSEVEVESLLSFFSQLTRAIASTRVKSLIRLFIIQARLTCKFKLHAIYCLISISLTKDVIGMAFTSSPDNKKTTSFVFPIIFPVFISSSEKRIRVNG